MVNPVAGTFTGKDGKVHNYTVQNGKVIENDTEIGTLNNTNGKCIFQGIGEYMGSTCDINEVRSLTLSYADGSKKSGKAAPITKTATQPAARPLPYERSNYSTLVEMQKNLKTLQLDKIEPIIWGLPITRMLESWRCDGPVITPGIVGYPYQNLPQAMLDQLEQIKINLDGAVITGKQFLAMHLGVKIPETQFTSTKPAPEHILTPRLITMLNEKMQTNPSNIGYPIDPSLAGKSIESLTPEQRADMDFALVRMDDKLVTGTQWLTTMTDYIYANRTEQPAQSNLPEIDKDTLFNSYDKDKNGGLSSLEISKDITQSLDLTSKSAGSFSNILYNLIDKNGDGVVDKDELAEFTSNPSIYTDQVIDELKKSGFLRYNWQPVIAVSGD